MSNIRSIVRGCETLTTDGFSKPDSGLPIRTLPGASASARFDVITATITGAMRLSLKGLDQ